MSLGTKSPGPVFHSASCSRLILARLRALATSRLVRVFLLECDVVSAEPKWLPHFLIDAHNSQRTSGPSILYNHVALASSDTYQVSGYESPQSFASSFMRARCLMQVVSCATPQAKLEIFLKRWDCLYRAVVSAPDASFLQQLSQRSLTQPSPASLDRSPSPTLRPTGHPSETSYHSYNQSYDSSMQHRSS
ncbi:hypothetical protein DL96DRAFT_1718368 [Flagelloscypha sp. PMI_526]|nr:hypothetical protein DL96DRAFT_1718368 [Flagelloscypha sp. PMI_526]